MRTAFITLFVFLSYLPQLPAQDVINMRSGEKLEAKVLEVGLTEVRYKKFNNLDGPVFIASRNDILNIVYENGTRDIFGEKENDYVRHERTGDHAEMFTKGRFDAARYYVNYKRAGTGTLLASLLSPPAGLIPAIICSSVPPRDRNLGYPRADLMADPDYRRGYTQKARGIKSRKVWTNWGIGFGVNILVVLVFMQ